MDPPLDVQTMCIYDVSTKLPLEIYLDNEALCKLKQ